MSLGFNTIYILRDIQIQFSIAISLGEYQSPPPTSAMCFFVVAFSGLLLSIYLCLCVILLLLPQPQRSCTKLPASLASVFWGRELVPGFQKAMLRFTLVSRIDFHDACFVRIQKHSTRKDMIG